MSYNYMKWTVLGAFIRAWMFKSGFHESLTERVEISTPMNSWKRVIEGVYLHSRSQSPYEGDVFHETPIALEFYSFLASLPLFILRASFIVTDILTALVMARAAGIFYKSMVSRQKADKKLYHEDASKLILDVNTVPSVVSSVLAAYMLNPYIIASCVAMTTTVHANFVLALLLWAVAVKSVIPACALLALASYQSFYPLMLLLPVSIAMFNNKNPVLSITKTLAWFAVFLSALLYISSELTGNWRFLESTYGCILKVPDLTPNIGLFWYFFTEMFDHFYVFFTYVFQLNPFIYVIPLGLRFSNNIPLLNFALCAIIAIFKSYPSVGDVGFYSSLLPMWNHLIPFFRHSFIVGCIMLVTSVLSPILWYLWIYTGSANANFFFATTLAFATAQIFLLTDVLFAQAKYDYHLKHGTDLKIDGKEAQLVLE